MPPKQKITREDILHCAMEIACEKGIQAVNSRSVAARIGCSIQPVFSHFPTMEELRSSTREYVRGVFLDEVMALEDDENFFQKVTLWVMDTARRRPNLFELFYLSDSFGRGEFISEMMGYESNQKIVLLMEKTYELTRKSAIRILEKSILLLLGISSMVAMNHMDYKDEYVLKIMNDSVSDMVEGEKRRAM